MPPQRRDTLSWGLRLQSALRGDPWGSGAASSLGSALGRFQNWCGVGQAVPAGADVLLFTCSFHERTSVPPSLAHPHSVAMGFLLLLP